MAEQSLSHLDFVDDLYLSAILDEEDDDPKPQQLNQHEEFTFQVSDHKFAEGLQFQEVLMGSVTISQFHKTNTPSSILAIQMPPNSNPKLMNIEPGESSKTPCEICVEPKETDQMFEINSCIHSSFCSDCIIKHLTIKIQESTSIITCPGLNCRAVLELENCRAKLPKEVIDLWEEALCEEMIRKEQIFYCPFKDCSGLLVEDDNGGEVIRESECPFCHRLFCAQCYVAWHSGIDCEAFQRLNKDERGREDLMVMELANEKKWCRCPHCKFFVERTEGCPHMTCRCKFQFCYGCGSEWSSSHGGCQRN